MAARGEPPLGDTQLRNELKRLGFTPGPITASTRSLLLKKLERLKEEEKKNRRKSTPARITSPKILAFSSEESDGEAAENSRGATPVNVSRRRSGQFKRIAPSKTTKRQSLGTKTSQTSKKGSSRKSVPVQSNIYDDENVEGENQEENYLLSDQISNAANTRNHRLATPSSEVLGGRRSLRGEKGAGDTNFQRISSTKDREQANFTGEFSESDDEVQESRKGVKSKRKSLGKRISRTPVSFPASRPSSSSRLLRKEPQSSVASHDAGSEEEEEEENDESASNNLEKGDTFVVAPPKDANTSGVSGRWYFLSRRRNVPQRNDEDQSASTSKEQEDDGNSSANWTFFTSRFNSSTRTSTPRKSRSSDDDTIYHSIAGNSTRQDVSVNAVAAPVSGRQSARGSALDATPTNHASFLGETPSTESSAPKAQEQMQSPNRSYIHIAHDSQTFYKEQQAEEAQVFATEENLTSSWRTKYGHFVSKLLLGSVCLFFIILALIYLSVNSTGKAGYLKIADLAGGDDTDFSGDEIPLQMVQALHVKLSQISGDFLCGKSVLGNMSYEEAKIYLNEDVSLRQKQGSRSPFWVVENLPRALQLITENKHWGLRLYKEDGEQLAHYDYETNEVVWLDSARAHMNLFCQVKTTLLNIFFWLSLLITAFLILWPIFLLFKYQKRRKEQEQQEVTQIVEKIIEVLANHQQACYKDRSLTPYLAIPHVRDTLIPPAERHKKQALWNKAVQFLNVNESRVRVETQQVAGEEFAVWRWVQPSPAVAVTSFSPITERDLNPKRVKVWQGTAFANLDTAVKASAYSYTQCLKVRNMFDPTLESGNNWHVTIQDAILERCGEDSGIVHVAVDKNSREGCVYVKCVTAEKAGMAFRCLQGSWFDGRLVTVKYIRLDRYHQRFPGALSANAPLRPSNNLRISLQPMPSSSN